jgi:hypothetical protein
VRGVQWTAQDFFPRPAALVGATGIAGGRFLCHVVTQNSFASLHSTDVKRIASCRNKKKQKRRRWQHNHVHSTTMCTAQSCVQQSANHHKTPQPFVPLKNLKKYRHKVTVEKKDIACQLFRSLQNVNQFRFG